MAQRLRPGFSTSATDAPADVNGTAIPRGFERAIRLYARAV